MLPARSTTSADVNRTSEFRHQRVFSMEQFASSPARQHHRAAEAENASLRAKTNIIRHRYNILSFWRLTDLLT